MIRILLTCPACNRLCAFASRTIRHRARLTCPACRTEFPCEGSTLRQAIRQLTAHKFRRARLR